MKTFYCTITSKYYLPRALCLFNSFIPFLRNKFFAFFCTDFEGADILKSLKLKNAMIFNPDDFETSFLKKIKNNRNLSEYSWTCKSIIINYAMNLDIEADWFIYLDSDMMVFSDPDNILLNKLDYNSIITPHNFANKKFFKYEKNVGIYNAGYIAFKKNKEGEKILQWWKEQCIKACNSTVSDVSYGDQKYLNYLPELFKGVYKSINEGLNIAPWNIENYKITKCNDKIYLDEKELLIFHFQGIEIYGYNIYDLYRGIELRITYKLFKYIYSLYMDGMINAFKEIRSLMPNFNYGISKMSFNDVLNYVKKSLMFTNNLKFKY